MRAALLVLLAMQQGAQDCGEKKAWRASLAASERGHSLRSMLPDLLSFVEPPPEGRNGSYIELVCAPAVYGDGNLTEQQLRQRRSRRGRFTGRPVNPSMAFHDGRIACLASNGK